MSFPDEQPQDQQLPQGMAQVEANRKDDVFELVEIFKQEQSEQRSQLTRTRELEN